MRGCGREVRDVKMPCSLWARAYDMLKRGIFTSRFNTFTLKGGHLLQHHYFKLYSFSTRLYSGCTGLKVGGCLSFYSSCCQLFIQGIFCFCVSSFYDDVSLTVV